jgi:hypothetical protein
VITRVLRAGSRFDLQRRMEHPQRFTGLKLSSKDRQEVRRRQSKGKMTARQWRRIQVLLMLDRGMSARATGVALGTYPREVSRVGKRYLDGGLELALGEEPRPGKQRKFDSTQEAALVAMVCGPPPEGSSRWTLRLVTQQAVRRGIVDDVGREAVRLVLGRQALKPWREKNVVRSSDRSGVRAADGRRAAAVRSPLPMAGASRGARRKAGATA